MKTSFRVKLIFETNKRGALGEPNEFTIQYLLDTINKGSFDIEAIGDSWTMNYEPVIIIKDK